MSDNLDSIFDQLKNLSGTSKVKEPTEDLTEENLEKFVLDKSKKLITQSLEILDEFQDIMTAAPGEHSAEALSNIINASSAAIETLNKVLITNKKITAAKTIKTMDIEARKEINKNDNDTRLLLTRQELMKQLLNTAIDVQAEVVDTKEPVKLENVPIPDQK